MQTVIPLLMLFLYCLIGVVVHSILIDDTHTSTAISLFVAFFWPISLMIGIYHNLTDWWKAKSKEDDL